VVVNTIFKKNENVHIIFICQNMSFFIYKSSCLFNRTYWKAAHTQIVRSLKCPHIAKKKTQTLYNTENAFKCVYLGLCWGGVCVQWGDVGLCWGGVGMLWGRNMYMCADALYCWSMCIRIIFLNRFKQRSNYFDFWKMSLFIYKSKYVFNRTYGKDA
jgi:hypothetical protein